MTSAPASRREQRHRAAPVARSSHRSPAAGRAAPRARPGPVEHRRQPLVSPPPTAPTEALRHLATCAPTPEHTADVADLFDEAAGRRLEAVAPLAQRLRPTTLDDFVGQAHVVGPGRALRLAIEADRVPSLDPLRAARARARRRWRASSRSTTGAEFEELSAVSATVANVRDVLARARERLGRDGRAHDPVPRRDPPLQQGAAGRAPARHRGGPRHPDRRDDREPVLRAQLGAALAHAALRARAACPRTTLLELIARGAAELDVERRAGARGADRRRAGGDARTALGILELAVADGARRGSRRRDATSRTLRASGRCSTTRAAKRTTTRSRPGSSRPAPATSRRRSTTSRRCWRAARTRASSPGG